VPQPSRAVDPPLPGYPTHTVLPVLLRVLLVAESESVRQPANVRIDRDPLDNAIRIAQHDVRGLAGHSREDEDLLHRVRHLPAVRLDDACARTTDGLRLLVEE